MSEDTAGRGTGPDSGETVGASDAAADAVRSGADVELPDDAQTDSDGVPVGQDDVEADARRSGADG